ncbi:MAG: lysophospholipid acyltransferase family protein [Planctomycetota bacterium]
MGRRSRERRAQRAWLVPLALPLLQVVARWVRDLPPRRAWQLASLLGLLFRWLRVTRATVRRNLELACGGLPAGPALERFEADYYRHMALLVVEFLRQPALTRERLPEALSDWSGLERALSIYRRGEGAIFVAGHAGVWELAGHIAGLAGVEILSVAKFSGHPDIDAFTSGIRESGGQQVKDVRGSLWGMKKQLDRKQAVGINVDQEARQGRVFAPFFGIPAATSNAPALLHLRTGAPIVVVTALRRGPFRYSLEVLDEIRHPPGPDRDADLVAITTRINRAMEAALRECPEQWLWSHRRWRRRPEDEQVPFARVDETPPLAI